MIFLMSLCGSLVLLICKEGEPWKHYEVYWTSYIGQVC